MSKKSFVVNRMDLLSRKTYPVEQLIRLVLVSSNLKLDKDHTLTGRGIYLLKDEATIDKVFSKGMLKRYSKTCDFDNLYKEVKEQCSAKN